MRQMPQLPLLGLLLASLLPSQLCKICDVSEDNPPWLNHLLNTMINSKYTSGIQAANVLLSLRLAGFQIQNLEQKLIQEIKDSVVRKGNELSSGQLAWTIMALRACRNPDETFVSDSNLLQRLQEKFQDEIKNMEAHDGNPLTNYYQLSQDVLALCLFNRNYPATKIAKFFTPENKNYYFGGKFSVDTGAMAVLAMTCVKRSIKNQQIKADENTSLKISNNIELLVKKILSEKKENGLLGNIYSTGEAMQALFVSSKYYKESAWNSQQTLATVMEEISRGAFNIPIAAAQLLPAMMRKTYLDVNKDSPCVCGSGTISIQGETPSPGSVSVTPTKSHSSIEVYYTVRINETFSTNLSVAAGSVFLDVMEAAQKQNKTVFGFTMEESSWGPYITSVQGLRANSNDRTYWEILSGDTPLTQGVGSYVVHDREHLEIRWSKY
ncbi:PREDICTED: transcobalamin-1 [Elephantulus edwardii]|uniref:transcobalamin-1 n=1 Tax=Elephantulus edwardii TaxID=28737 RepID=UPI0003F08F54|nr:PREDICTED: transcobalamin-1 [Elephantulus edwardii]